MPVRRWMRETGRFLRRFRAHGPGSHRRQGPQVHPLLVTLAVAALVAGGIIGLLEARLRPVAEIAARTQAQNTITALVEHAVMEDLARRAVGYGDLVTIQRDGAGTITALTTDMAAMNLLRGELISQVLQALEGVDVSQISIPLGSLFFSEVTWARGPAIQAQALRVGTVSGEFESDFSAAGVNQTRHRICLNLSIPVTVLLSGSRIEVPVETSLCVAETVIVGQVPNTYLQVDGSAFKM